MSDYREIAQAFARRFLYYYVAGSHSIGNPSFADHEETVKRAREIDALVETNFLSKHLTPEFVIVHHRVSDAPDIYNFAHESDGMLIGAQQGHTAVWTAYGDEREQHVFIDGEWATKWLKQKCRELCGREDVTFRAIDGGNQIVIPRGNRIQQ